VNGVEMSGKTQEDVVSYLRSIKFGSVVNIIVSRADSDRMAHQALPTSTVVLHILLHNDDNSDTVKLFIKEYESFNEHV